MKSIRAALADAQAAAPWVLWGAPASVSVGDLTQRTSLEGRRHELAGRSVLIATRDHLPAAVAMLELDGVARRIVVCPPDIAAEHMPAVVEKAGVDAIVSDRDPTSAGEWGASVRVTSNLALSPAETVDVDECETEWVLLTSGTTGAPKLIVHTLASLTAPIAVAPSHGTDVVWATFYDIRRYGGLQIFLRAIRGRRSIVLAGIDESPGDYLARLGARGVTHISGTPSHWRRALMNPSAHAISPRYVRLSGEIADQALLTTLRSFYPEASVGHAYASTEAGVGFEVNDGLEGFPTDVVGAPGPVEIKIEDRSLRIRSPRTARCYLGEDVTLRDDEGFVDTGDIVERRGERYYFLGRRSGVINVGGQKVYPEEVEAVIARHPAVRMACVRSRRSPITGSLVVADVVVDGEPTPDHKSDILRLCHERLAPYKVPAAIRFVPALDVGAAGKLVRQHA
jgi:acyl-coenzyme A synthetase/AMP-(fatty) acid ligase